ncbi:MAG: DNA methyltransferase [Candidatus Woesearchaeota archaeon]
MSQINIYDLMEDTDKNLKEKLRAEDVTFKNNETSSIHRWYPYIEGFSMSFVKTILEGFDRDIKVYDPFNGCGTTTTTSGYMGIESYASEINPIMKFIAKTKINTVKNVISDNKIEDLEKIAKKFNEINYNSSNITVSEYLNSCYLDDEFFPKENLKKIAFLKNKIYSINDEDIKNIFKLCLISIIVKLSNMKRAADLRTKTETELKNRKNNVIQIFNKKLKEMINDIKSVKDKNIRKMKFINENAKEINKEYIEKFDVIITSPPYVNGTNYFRNTKLELWIMDYINKKSDLKSFRTKAITAGINNVSKRIDEIDKFDFVEKYARQLDEVANDVRIPKLIRAYFSDMNKVFNNLSNMLKPEGKIYFDIGDSEYYGVHVPVHEIIKKIAECNNLSLKDNFKVRGRKSKSGTKLSQKLLIFKKSVKNLKITDDVERVKKGSYKTSTKEFIENLPYLHEPYSKRNWGHNWHSLCSFQGKLKPAIAHFLVKKCTKDNDVVLDPLSGVGTIPFEACLQNREGIGNDLSPQAFVITKAKLEKPSKKEAKKSLKKLERYINKNKKEFNGDEFSDFGYNGNLPEYFHTETYKEILAGREYIQKNIKSVTTPQAFVFSIFFHILHGNRPYALSRRSHPLTPYSPKGEFEYKKVVDHINDKLERSFSKKISWRNFKTGKAYNKDYKDLPNFIDKKIDVIITSPPFYSSLAFITNNWMRLWLSGWEPEDYEKAKDTFLSARQKKDLDVYKNFFKSCNYMLKNNGKLIMHLGKSKKCNMMKELSTRCQKYFKVVNKGKEKVENLEKHGIADKGGTTDHQFLFLQKK